VAGKPVLSCLAVAVAHSGETVFIPPFGDDGRAASLSEHRNHFTTRPQWATVRRIVMITARTCQFA
jgi:hypothetical protein